MEKTAAKSTQTVIAHFYRATVMHADVWRRRLDATTNWAIVSTAGVVTFAFSDPSNPHIALLLAIPFICLFILMESRRYQMYDLWRHRVRLLNRFFIAPALSPDTAESEDRVAHELAKIALEIGTSIPRISKVEAIGYRIRRNYMLLFFAVLIMWIIKIIAQPTPVSTFGDFYERTRISFLPGWVTFCSIGVFCSLVVFLAMHAPTERMSDWKVLPSPLDELLERDASSMELSLCTDSEIEEL